LELEAVPAADPALALKFPTQFAGCSENGVFLALENSGKTKSGSGFAVFFQPGHEMDKKGVVEVSDNQICFWEGSPKSVLDVK